MTPTPHEQKAEELIERFSAYVYPEYPEDHDQEYDKCTNACLCAIIHIDETITLLSSMKLIFSDRELILKEQKQIKQYLLNKM